MTDSEHDSDKPDWLTLEQDQTEPEPGTLVNSAIEKARSRVAAREVIELCVGNIFSVFLALLAPFIKTIADSVANVKATDRSD